MGYIKHHAIVVTSSNDGLLARARAEATELGCSVTPITSPVMNGQRSFLIAPDGSKEGWQHSDEGDDARDEFVKWANAQRYEDGSTSLAWAEVVIGSDDNEAHVSRHAWQTDEAHA